jgi:hypothetical protein
MQTIHGFREIAGALTTSVTSIGFSKWESLIPPRIPFSNSTWSGCCPTSSVDRSDIEEQAPVSRQRSGNRAVRIEGTIHLTGQVQNMAGGANAITVQRKTGTEAPVSILLPPKPSRVAGDPMPVALPDRSAPALHLRPESRAATGLPRRFDCTLARAFGPDPGTGNATSENDLARLRAHDPPFWKELAQFWKVLSI